MAQKQIETQILSIRRVSGTVEKLTMPTRGEDHCQSICRPESQLRFQEDNDSKDRANFN